MAPVELVPGRVYALGGCVPLDGRVSWAPVKASRHQSVNCYLLKEGDQALLVDTGLPLHEREVLEQLGQLLEPGSPLKIFFTRAELDCVANLPALREVYDIETVLSGGKENAFDAFDAAGAVGRATGIDLGPHRHVRVIVPSVRILPTFWLYDEATRALFTSDLFTHTDQAAEWPVEVVENGGSPKGVADHLFCKLWWLPGARTEPLVIDLERTFAELQPEVVAPTYGCVLRGRAVIASHVAALTDVLRSCGR